MKYWWKWSLGPAIEIIPKAIARVGPTEKDRHKGDQLSA
jgi:hypothetical protein